MEFEDMKKVWDAQNDETLYVINEERLHQSIKSKRNAANRRMNKVELGITFINSFCALFLFVDALNDSHVWDYFASLIMVITVVYIQVTRRKRKRGEGQFDRTILGDLDHAISNTRSLLYFNYMMIVGYFIPACLFYGSKMFFTEASMAKWVLMTVAFILAFALVFFERKKIINPRLKALIGMREKLLCE